MAAEIVGIDVLWYDQLITLQKLPEDNGSAPIESSSAQGGGKVCTAMAAAARQGIACKLLAVAGDGARGRFLVEELARDGVDTAAIRTVSGYREGFSVVISDAQSGGRRILWRPDSGEGGLTAADVDAIRTDLEAARYLHLCRMDSVDRRAAEIARAAGVSVSFDGDFYTQDAADSLSLVDILIGSEEFYRDCFQAGGDFWDNIDKLVQKGPQTVIFTFGKEGCRGIAHGERFTVPAFTKNIAVVDTVGAGDVFHGGYLSALCMGYQGREAARYAGAVSAIKCTTVGGRAGIPTRSMVEAYLSSETFPAKGLWSRVAFYQEQ